MRTGRLNTEKRALPRVFSRLNRSSFVSIAGRIRIIAAGRAGAGMVVRSRAICGGAGGYGEHPENLIQCSDTHDIIPCTKNDGTT